jgi:hypothetical protein
MVITVEYSKRRSHLTCSHEFSNLLSMIRCVNCWLGSVVYPNSGDLPRLNMLGESTSVGPGWLRQQY